MPTQPDNLQPIGFAGSKQQIQGKMTNIEEAILWSQTYLKYSELTLNQYGVASPCRTICTVCGFVALS